MNKTFTLATIICLWTLFLINVPVFSQYTISGTVYGVEGTEATLPMPNAIVLAKGLDAPTISDKNGKYQLVCPTDTCILIVNYALYEPYLDTLVFPKGSRHLNWNIYLRTAVHEIGQVSVTAIRIDDNAVTSTISKQMISPMKMDNMNITSAGDLLNKVGGVAIVNDEPQIRGGSGFSSGMGSRVMILLDNMPLLRPDAGRPMWNFIPMEDVEDIEITKGASSVVYGSSALTGAINVHTAYPRSKPKTKVKIFSGIYDSPKDKYKKSWDLVNPLKWGASFLHSRVIKKDFDLVLGGEYYNDQSYVGPEYKIKDGFSHEGKYETRARFNFSTRYRPSKVRGLVASLNGNFMYSDEAQSFFWYDSDTNMYRTYKGSLTATKDFMFYIDPVISYTLANSSQFTLQNRVLYSNNEERTGAQSAQSLMVYDEIKYIKNLRRIGMKIEVGALSNYARSFGRVFSGSNSDTMPALMTVENFALYAQLEEKIPGVRGLTIVGGARWEAFFTDKKFNQAPIFRLGVNYQIPRAFTSFRFSIGQGYRYPSIGEKYISISVGNYGFYPNPDLVPETSWNAELGIVQPYRMKGFQGILDVAVFHQEYKNFIEFGFGAWGTDLNFTKNFGFKYMNTGPASITGVDVSLVGEGKLCPQVFFQFMASYTYSYPITKNADSTFYARASDKTTKVLKYRIQHLAKFDMTFTFWDKLSLNFAASYFSSMKNVDEMFFDYDMDNPELPSSNLSLVRSMGDLPFKGYYNYFHSHTKGSVVLDLGITYHILKDLKLSFIVKNFLNNEYTLRPMYVEAPRTFNVQISYGI